MERVAKRYARGEVEHVDWLDRLALRAVGDLRAREAARRADADDEDAMPAAAAAPAASADTAGAPDAAALVAPGGLQLAVELPAFPRAVIYQQAGVGAHGGAAGAPTPGATADAISTPLPGTGGAGGGALGAAGAGAPPPSAASLILVHDWEAGRGNPAEGKAAKLARGLSRGLVDRRLKPDTEERRRIEAVLDHPPNRCGGAGERMQAVRGRCGGPLAAAHASAGCRTLAPSCSWSQPSSCPPHPPTPAPPTRSPLSADDKALLWRFRFALTPDPRALTKFLKCVDWADASEARQVRARAGRWLGVRARGARAR